MLLTENNEMQTYYLFTKRLEISVKRDENAYNKHAQSDHESIVSHNLTVYLQMQNYQHQTSSTVNSCV